MGGWVGGWVHEYTKPSRAISGQDKPQASQLNMPLIPRYTYLKKKTELYKLPHSYRYMAFTPVRAIGLAVELGHSLARDHGKGTVTAEQLEKVAVKGQLMLFDGGSWRHTRSCSLALRPEDAKLANLIFLKQRAFFADLQLNLWFTGPHNRGVGKGLDLLGDFSGPVEFGVEGRLWVELKVLSAATFARSLHQQESLLPALLEKAQSADTSIGAVLLVATKVEKTGNSWEPPVLIAKLYDGNEWLDISSGGGCRVAAGHVRAATKPSLQTVFAKMQWQCRPQGGPRLGQVSHFLDELGLQSGNAGKSANSLNKKLDRTTIQGRFEQVDFPDRPGAQPWCGTKALFRAVYKTM